VSTTSALLDRAYDVMVNGGATATSAARAVRALADAGMLTDPRDAEPAQPPKEPSVTDAAPDLDEQVAALRVGQRVRLVYGQDDNTLTVEGVLGWGNIGRSVTVGAGASSLVVRNANGSPHPDLIAVEVLPPPLPTGVGAVIDATVKHGYEHREGVRCMFTQDGTWHSAEPVGSYNCHPPKHIVAVERVIDPGEERS
jgi:hypothetical protein